MKITKKGNKAYLSVTKAELAANPRLLKVLQSQGFVGNTGVFDEPGVEEAYPDDANPIQSPGEEAHDPFTHEVEQVFKKHNKHFSPEIEHHVKNAKGLPPEALTPDHAGSGETYQDGTDPGKPYGGGFSVSPMGGGMGGGFGGMGSVARSKKGIK